MPFVNSRVFSQTLAVNSRAFHRRYCGCTINSFPNLVSPNNNDIYFVPKRAKDRDTAGGALLCASQRPLGQLQGLSPAAEGSLAHSSASHCWQSARFQRGCQPQHPHVASPWGLGFLAMRYLESRAQHPKPEPRKATLSLMTQPTAPLPLDSSN